MSKIDYESALFDFERWIEYKKISDKRRKAQADSEEVIINAIQEGDLIMDDDFSFNYILKFPITNDKGEVTISELNFKPRIKMRAIHDKLKGIKSNDADGRVFAYIAALTDNSVAIIEHLDTEDISICNAIVVYFL